MYIVMVLSDQMLTKCTVAYPYEMDNFEHSIFMYQLFITLSRVMINCNKDNQGTFKTDLLYSSMYSLCV